MVLVVNGSIKCPNTPIRLKDGRIGAEGNLRRLH